MATRRKLDDGIHAHNQLRDFLQDLLPTILQYREHPINEENTKVSIIERVLKELGWNTLDCNEVDREYKVRGTDNPVDYALAIMRTPRLLVEAKALGEDLSNRQCVSQIIKYAAVAGVEWCVLTDGDEWRFYNSAAAVEAEEKQFLKVRISEGNLDYVADTLALLSRDNIEGNLLEPLWAAHFVDRRVKKVLREMFDSCDRAIVRLIRRKLPKLKTKQIVESLGRLEVRIDSPVIRHPAGTPPPEPGTPPLEPGLQPGGRGKRTVSQKDMVGAGMLKPPCKLFRKYKGQMLKATWLSNGLVEFGGKRYESLSAAAVAACASVTGEKRAAGGWKFWYVKDRQGQERTLDDLRNACKSRD